MGQEKLFEGGVVVGHLLGEFGLVQVAGQAFGEWRGLADGFFYDVGEFCGVGCSQDEALGRFGMFLAVGFPGVNADSGVRIGDVADSGPRRHAFRCRVSSSVAPWPQISLRTFSRRLRHRSSRRGKLFGLPTSMALEYVATAGRG